MKDVQKATIALQAAVMETEETESSIEGSSYEV